MSDLVKMTLQPGGHRVVQNNDDTEVKAEALRLGLLPAISAGLRERTGQRGAAALIQDGDRLVAIVAWAGFASEKDNGWASLSVTPACKETSDWLVAVTHRMINATGMRFLERSSPWRN